MKSARLFVLVALAVFLGATAAFAASSRFADVPDNYGFLDDIEWMADSGITRGCGDGTNFCPEDAVTRAQMAAFMHRLARQVVGTREPVQLFAAASVEPFTGIYGSVGPFDSFTRLGPGEYRFEMAEEFMAGAADFGKVFVSATPIGATGQACTWDPEVAPATSSGFNVHCFETAGGPADMAFTIMMWSTYTDLDNL